MKDKLKIIERQNNVLHKLSHIDFNLVSYIGVPIRVNSKVYGTINFSSAEARQLEYDEIV